MVTLLDAVLTTSVGDSEGRVPAAAAECMWYCLLACSFKILLRIGTSRLLTFTVQSMPWWMLG